MIHRTTDAAIMAVATETNTPVMDVQTKGLAYYTSVGYDYVSTTITLDVLRFKTEGAYQSLPSRPRRRDSREPAVSHTQRQAPNK